MTLTATPKILIPLTLGSLELAHRAVVLVREGLSGQRLGRLATPGGLLIAAPGFDWAKAAANLHDDGAFLVAALPAEDAITAGQAAMDGGCDGLEFHAAGLAQAPLLQILDLALDRWEPARLGVRLHCAGTEAGLDAVVEMLTALNELELGFVQLSGSPGPGEARQRLRAAFRWPLIVSGDFGVAEALAMVESRWADAVGFTVADGPALLEALRAGAASRPDG
jgi:hypothetical protein